MRNSEITVLKCAAAVFLSLPLVNAAHITYDVMSMFQLLWYAASVFAMAVFGFPKLRGALADELAKAPGSVHAMLGFLNRYEGVIWPVLISAAVISSIVSAPLSDQKIGVLEVMMLLLYTVFAAVGGLYAFRAARKGEPFWSALGKRRDKPQVT